MATISIAAAQQIMQRHGIESRATDDGALKALAVFTLHGIAGAEWERVPLNLTAIRDWLGY